MYQVDVKFFYHIISPNSNIKLLPLQGKLMFQRSASMQVVKHGLETCHFILLLFSSDQIVLTH